MRLTKQTNYAVRALMYCALNSDQLSRIADIARAYGISELFLFKIVRPLVDGGLIETARGRKGGIRLARPAREITVAQAVRLAEASFAISECFEKESSDCPLLGNCAYCDSLEAALKAFLDELEGVTIADLVKDAHRMRERLGIEAAVA